MAHLNEDNFPTANNTLATSSKDVTKFIIRRSSILGL